mmetsp:Transcript_130708/g.365711  ORF Transcript_130708/g.365711 Transcript_130708/m.365711 type:complete len:120 (+) Transcript_130708:239-598(+)
MRPQQLHRQRRHSPLRPSSRESLGRSHESLQIGRRATSRQTPGSRHLRRRIALLACYSQVLRPCRASARLAECHMRPADRPGYAPPSCERLAARSACAGTTAMRMLVERSRSARVVSSL